MDVATGVSLMDYQFTESSIAQIHNLKQMYGPLFSSIEEHVCSNMMKVTVANQTTFYDTVYPTNGTAAWPDGTTTVSKQVPWDGSAKTVLMFAIVIFVVSFLWVLFAFRTWYSERGQEQKE